MAMDIGITGSSGEPPCDEDIIELYWNRDQRAIARTDLKYGRFVFGVAYNILKDKEDCEECKNDTYIRVWNAVPPERPVSLRAYLAGIVRRLAINRYKMKTSKRRIPSELTLSIDELEGALGGTLAYSDEEEATRELGALINQYVRGLSEKQRYIFVRRYYFAEGVDDIGEVLGLTKSAVYKELTKIKNGLKEYLERSGVYI